MNLAPENDRHTWAVWAILAAIWMWLFGPARKAERKARKQLEREARRRLIAEGRMRGEIVRDIQRQIDDLTKGN